jgi:hypothetical protein
LFIIVIDAQKGSGSGKDSSVLLPLAVKIHQTPVPLRAKRSVLDVSEAFCATSIGLRQATQLQAQQIF